MRPLKFIEGLSVSVSLAVMVGISYALDNKGAIVRAAMTSAPAICVRLTANCQTAD